MNISAVILAAGKSVRMGQPKMLMPWGNTTVLGQVVQTLQAAGVEDITLVTNSTIAGQVTSYGVRVALSDEGEMLESVQIGLRAQKPSVEAVLICLGDQPQAEEENVRRVCDGFRQSKSPLVVPSYQMRRGHPWLITRELWDEILQLRAPKSMRDFLNAYKDKIFYVECDSPTILQDLDTPADYLKYKP
ncbi:molybdenum cofactor cytidylyltransferase [Anaerolineales bacterium]|nr:molybdenum cofactor cytidylyltransferase [Anaerolineales bacterium]